MLHISAQWRSSNADKVALSPQIQSPALLNTLSESGGKTAGILQRSLHQFLKRFVLVFISAEAFHSGLDLK
ncbi:hypothetical protein PHYPO_G00136570 [Pangasianodon hypophthalmus]|uniref:Uncharacterized protein n=1 Tax=Pangasianodon hypophthalmus TaxID=310915 RepID=A0A5N5KL10_PANHP|nr:hypothetical protein PHYPO_G00136570 [Pangasianodon hypophthalmus]